MKDKNELISREKIHDLILLPNNSRKWQNAIFSYYLISSFEIL